MGAVGRKRSALVKRRGLLRKGKEASLARSLFTAPRAIRRPAAAAAGAAGLPAAAAAAGAADLGGFKGSATKGQLRKRGLTFCCSCSKYDPYKNKARVCNKALESNKNMFFKFHDPLPWTLNFPSADPVAPPAAAQPQAGEARGILCIIFVCVYIYIYIYT